jgi:hypothetical protein
MIGGLGAAAALVFTVRTYWLSRQQHVTEQYSRAIEQLGASPYGQVGGIFALERIMVDSARDHGAIVDLLCAFVRQAAPVSGDTRPWAGGPKPPRPSAPVQAALTVLARRPVRRRHEANPLRLSDLVLDRARLRGAPFRCARLRRSRLAYAHLERADLRGALCSGVDLRHAHLEDARLDHARLVGASLAGARLAGASMHGAHLAGATGVIKDQLTEQQLASAHCRPEQPECTDERQGERGCRRYE